MESIEIAPSYSSIKKSILSRFVNIENFEKLKNRKTQIARSTSAGRPLRAALLHTILWLHASGSWKKE